MPAQPIAHRLASTTDIGRNRLVRGPEQEMLEGGAISVDCGRIGSSLEQIQHTLRLVDLGRLMQWRIAGAIGGVGIGAGGEQVVELTYPLLPSRTRDARHANSGARGPPARTNPKPVLGEAAPRSCGSPSS